MVAGIARFPGWGIAFLLVLSACGGSPKQALPAKDLESFLLPEEVKRAAPHMQQHLHRLLPYNSVHFSVKPQFVFIDDYQLTAGQINLAVSRLNLLHMAYRRQGTLHWSGSLMVSVGMGATVFSRQGARIALSVTETGDYSFSWEAEEALFQTSFAVDEDFVTRLPSADGELYLYFYTFPADLIRPDQGSSEPGSGATR